MIDGGAKGTRVDLVKVYLSNAHIVKVKREEEKNEKMVDIEADGETNRNAEKEEAEKSGEEEDQEEEEDAEEEEEEEEEEDIVEEDDIDRSEFYLVVYKVCL